MIDLVYCSPEALANDFDGDGLLATLKQKDRWEPREAEVLGYVYKQMVLRLLTGRAGRDALRALSEHLEKIEKTGGFVGLGELDPRWPVRWRAYRDLLDTRIVELASDVPDRIMKRAHVPTVMKLLAKGVRTQKEICDRTGLSESNLTRLLGVMERAELIDREQEGRINRVRPGARGMPIVEKIAESLAASGSEEPRGLSYLTASNG